jgi:integrase
MRKGGRKKGGEKDLTALQVKALTAPGAWRVSRCLYVQITDTGSRSWLMRYMLNGISREMGLGPCDLLTLAEARAKVSEYRRLLLEGIDPIEHRRQKRREKMLASASAITFRVCAERYIAAHEAGWKNGKHRNQWQSTLETYAYPVLGDLPVASIETAHIMQVLEPIWATKAETASRIRGRIESIWDWAKARGYCNGGENPARWRGHLQKLLPARSKVSPVEHHEALPYADAPDFMAELRKRDGTAARCLEFTILTWTRSGEARGARWDEVDFKTRQWVVPAPRMKAGKAHVVPLSDAAAALLEAMPRTGELIFEGAKAGKPISDMSMTMVLRRMGHADITVHGFRSTAKDWASETTSHPDIVSEMALAHTILEKVQKAYRRGALLKKRRKLMADWAKYCGLSCGLPPLCAIARAITTT